MSLEDTIANSHLGEIIAQLTLVQSRTTKGTVVYEHPNPSANPAVPTVYIKKSAMPAPYPESIVITIQERK